MLNSWHHARYYFFFFAAMGLVSPYFGWWLGSVMPPEDIKWALAIFYATLIVVPSVWGHAAFSGQKPGNWLSHGTLLATIFALGLTQIDQNIALGAACFLVLAFGVFFNPLLPLLEAMAYSQMGDEEKYSRIRLVGSLGFLTCSSLIGGIFLIDQPNLFPICVAGLMFGTWLVSLPYKNVEHASVSSTAGQALEELHAPEAGVAGSLKKLSGLWLVTLLTQAAFACYYAFYALHLKSIGLVGWQIGLLIGVSVAAEVFAFWKINWFFKRASVFTLLLVASMLSAVRWLVFSEASPSIFSWLVVLQLTHAIGFSVFHTACLKLIHDNTPTAHFGAAQGFYNAIGYGVGGVAGVFVSGMLWVDHGGSAVFLFAAVLSLLAAFCSLLIGRQLRLKNKPPLPPPSVPT